VREEQATARAIRAWLDAHFLGLLRDRASRAMRLTHKPAAP
jgi:hypothetical protein